MDNKKLYSIIANNLQKNSNNNSANEIFGLLSILVLLEITEIYQETNLVLPEKRKQSSPMGNIGNLGNLAGLLSQLQGSEESNNNIQQMLPMLMSALGNNNTSNLDLGKITNLLNSIKKDPSGIDNDHDGEIDIHESEDEIDKKKVSRK